MKVITFFLLVLSCSFGYADSTVSRIYEEAYALKAHELEYEKDSEELLFDFYSEKIASLDVKTLQENPELVFRKGLAFFERPMMSDEDAPSFFSELVRRYVELEKDLQFVLDYARKDSRLFQSAKLIREIVLALLRAPSCDPDTWEKTMFAYFETVLQEWATNSSLTGRALRENVYQNICANDSVRNAFCQFVLLTNEDPDLALGYIEPDRIEVLGLAEENGSLVYQIDYHLTSQFSIGYSSSL
ncbi:MAG: hypothetical protein Q8L98_07365 [Chlamydiales bacterium]|nr:hypothetical protein [Chlamydiales bacterium]